MATLPPGHRLPLHHWHVAHGACFAESDGWPVPLSYTDPRLEVEAARNGVGLADISAFAKRSLRGPGVSAVAAALGNLPLRRVRTVDGGTACRLSKQCMFLLASSTNKAGLAKWLASSAEMVSTDITSAFAGFAVAGKHAEIVIGRLTSFEVAKKQFPEGTCAETELAGVHALLVRPPARSVPEMAVYVGWDVSEYVWESMLRVGGDLRLAPVGHDGLTALRAAL